VEFALVVRELLSRWRWLLLGFVLAGAAAFLMSKPKSLVYSAASTQVFVDTSSSVLGNTSQNTIGLENLASLYANFMASPTILEMIGRQVGLSGGQIYAAGPVDPNLPRTIQEPTDLQRNVQLTGESTPYRLGFTADPNAPQIGIYAQAPTTPLAVALANASVVALQQYVGHLEAADNVPAADRAVIRPLGSAIGSVVNSGMRKQLAVMVFVAVLALWCCLMLAGARFAAVWRRSGAVHRGHRDGSSDPQQAPAHAATSPQSPAHARDPSHDPVPPDEDADMAWVNGPPVAQIPNGHGLQSSPRAALER
jgi:hypothetical protein